MADDAAAPEGKLSGSEEDTTSPEGPTESPQVTEPERSADSTADGTAESEVEEATSGEAVSEDDSDVSDDSDEVLDDEAEDFDAAVMTGELAPAGESISPVKLATIIGVVVVLALGGVVGWLGFRSVESRAAAEQRSVYLQVGRQAALNLTTINFETVDTDVQRILDSATDSFYDDFSARSQPFVDVVKQAQSQSVGEVTSAGLEPESVTDNEAQVLVAITVKTSNAGAPEQDPRAWRMRISVKQVGEETKVSNVEFVP